MKLKNMLVMFAAVVVAGGCCTAGVSQGAVPVAAHVAIRVGTCNVRVWSKKDLAEGNVWDERKDDLIALLRRLDMDVFGFQEVHGRPYRELCAGLKEWELVDDYDVSTPVAYRKSRFDLVKKGVFWLSETPDVPRSMGWGAKYIRPCLYLILKDKQSGRKLCFVNTHTDHIAVKARRGSRV